MVRTLITVLFFTSIFLFPWYVTAVLGIALLVFSSGFEVLLGGLMLDLLYAAPLPQYFNTTLLYTVGCIALVGAAFFIKKQLVFY